MKSKQLKKVLAMLLVFTIMAGTLVIRVDAITTFKTNYIGTWVIGVGGTVTTAARIPLCKSDSLDVNLTFTPSASFSYYPQDVDFGLVDDSDTFSYFSLGMSGYGNRINSTDLVRAGKETNYRFRVRNRLPVPVTVTGTFTYVKNPKALSQKGGLGIPYATIYCSRYSYISQTEWDYEWMPDIKSACNAWYAGGASIGAVDFLSMPGTHSLQVGAYNTDWNGETTKYPLFQNVPVTSSIIKINTSGTLGNPNTRQLRRATIAHEIGHLLWLADHTSYPSPYRSIMSYDWVHNGNIIYPQQYDVYNVSFIYS